MKKFLLLLHLFLGSAFGVRAQQSRYQGEVNLGFTYGPFKTEWSALGLHTVHGARTSDHFFVGGGLGLEAVAGDSGGAGFLVPIYLDFKGFLDASKPTTGYVTLDIGLIPNFGSGDPSAGFYLCPAVGIKARRFKADLGYKLMDEFGAIQFRVGLFLGGGKYRK